LSQDNKFDLQDKFNKEDYYHPIKIYRKDGTTEEVVGEIRYYINFQRSSQMNGYSGTCQVILDTFVV